jgi:hypothetical protein
MKSRFLEGRQAVPSAGSIWLVLRAYAELLLVDVRLAHRGFPLAYERVKNCQVREGCSRGEREVCRAVDLASVFYFKQVRCLQRSAVTTVLLRQAGVAAEMVIGVQQCPFRSHAWVEVAGRVVNDKPYTAAMYTVLERC